MNDKFSSGIMPVTAILCLLLTACSPQRIVYTQKVGGPYVGQEDIYLVTENADNSGNPLPRVALATSADPEFPCGALPDGRVVYTRKSGVSSGAAPNYDMYVVNPDGSGTRPLLNTLINESCVNVGADGFVIYRQSVPGGTGSNLRAKHVDTAQELEIATSPYDQSFLKIAPDGHILFLRQEPYNGGKFGLYSYKPGTDPYPRRLVGALGFPPYQGEPRFQGVTSNNRVVYSMYAENVQNQGSTNIYSIGTDGSNPVALATSWNHDNFCAIAADGRVFYTERYYSTVNGETFGRGDIFSVQDDGTNRVAMRHSVVHEDDQCQAITINGNVIYSRHFTYSPPHYRAWDALYSISADGAGQEVPIAFERGTSYTFDSVTISSRVLYTNLSAQNSFELYSVNPDGTGLVALGSSVGLGEYSAGATISDNVIFYRFNGLQKDMYIVAASGGTPNPIATTPDDEGLAFIF